MRIALIGATGRTGVHVLEQALAAGMTVRVLARRAEAIPRSANVDVVQGSVTDESAVRELIAPDCDAVVSALGIAEPKAPTSVFSDGTGLVAARMHQTGVKRLVVISASGPAQAWREYSVRISDQPARPCARDARVHSRRDDLWETALRREVA